MKQETLDLIQNAENKVAKQFAVTDEIKEYNQEKVLDSFIKNQVGMQHFYTVSGYGHDDIGRETLDNVFADVFHAEKAMARPHFVSGTHTLSCCLFGCLRHGDKLLSVAGSPYDTMEEVIGKRGNYKQSLMGHGVKYDEVPLLNDTDVDFDTLCKRVDKSTTMVLIQRSRGYSLRKSLDIDTIKKIVETVKSKNPECICFVDNCYGEFTEKLEPTDVGADLIAGSLIKNAGGGIVEAGGYIAGKDELVELVAASLTAPGICREGGAMFNQTRLMFQGLFMAPSIVAEAVKGAILASQVFEDIGFVSTPKPHEKRTDLIQTIKFGAKEPLIEFCKTVQQCSPVESYLTPVPDVVPGYDDDLIMAGGTFVEGSTIELSADGPVRPPYAVYMQGGLNYAHVKITLKRIVDKLVK
ncbi:MAG: methionine gamma-lyase family protein [Candidatus Gastranaerophilales bacterium]|nr:methionine gamma-lyase family protein [Candidatus Gastranaerophilales bacterium]